MQGKSALPKLRARAQGSAGDEKREACSPLDPQTPKPDHVRLSGYGNTTKLPKAPRSLTVGSVVAAMFPVVGSKTFTPAAVGECIATLIG